MTSHKAARYVLLGQLSLFFFLFICFLIIPHFLLKPNEGGVSNYGLYAKTVVPYTLAFGLAGILNLQAARFISGKPLRRTVMVVGFLLLAALLSTYPYKVNRALNDIHIYVGIILLTTEMIAGIWFGCFLARNATNIILLLILLIGFLFASLTFFGVIHILFVAELLTSLAFGVLQWRTVKGN